MSTNSSQVRSATLDDIDRLAELMRFSAQVLGQGFYDQVQVLDAATFLTVPDPEVIAQGTYYLAESDGQVVGCGGWSSLRKLYVGRESDEESQPARLDPRSDSAKIRSFFTHPDFKRRGIAKLIYEKCEREAVMQGWQSFELMATLPGEPLYRALGFTPIASEDIQLPNGRWLPCVRMTKPIT